MHFQHVPPPTPHQHPTLRRAQRVLQALRVRVAPEDEAPKAAARDQ
jgi:predicted PP-loop superfamily ATPase